MDINQRDRQVTLHLAESEIIYLTSATSLNVPQSSHQLPFLPLSQHTATITYQHHLRIYQASKVYQQVQQEYQHQR